MEQLKRLLTDLERISFQDISEVPKERQHEIAEQIEKLQDSLSTLSQFKGNTVKTL
jgi:ribosomal protein S18|tara:strand:+ start:78910 stop:79077 length:168 start_codon:yes stop_codon:yes gene_type:complete